MKDSVRPARYLPLNPNETAPGQSRRHGILLVDDNDHIRTLLEIGLQQEGFKVWSAADGSQAIELYQQRPHEIDVVLLDVQMPKMDGPRTLGILKQLNSSVRCCFMSGNLGSYREDQLLSMGAASVLAKPFTIATLAPILRNVANRTQK